MKARRNSLIIIIIIQLFTFSRSIAAFVFVCTALYTEHSILLSAIFLYACLGDLLDGYLARKFSIASRGGKALDLFGDKYLTISCILYSYARGIPSVPCALIIFKEVLVLAMRQIEYKGDMIFPPQRIIGGITVLFIWGATFLLINYSNVAYLSWTIIVIGFWIAGLMSLLNLIQKILNNWDKLLIIFKS